MKRLNNVILRLIVFDFFFNSSWGLIGPIFAIFITQQIEGGSIEAVAFATATFWMAKSLFQPLMSNKIDIIKGEKDDFKLLIFGSIGSTIVTFLYFFVTILPQIFILQFFRGIFIACVAASFNGMFTRHITKGWESFSWTIWDTTTGIVIAFSAIFGGIMVSLISFRSIFIAIGLFKVLSLFIILKDGKKIFK